MLVFNKTPSGRGKCNISVPISKESRRVSTVNVRRITKENKKFLQDIGLKLK